MFLAIHAALQVFRPAVTTFDVDDGIYPHRLYTYLTIFLAPILLASLAFINGGYTSQGVFCALPRVPLWSRLVLAWFPRWIIVIIVVGLAMGVYIHVSKQLVEISSSQPSSKLSMNNEVARRSLPTLFSDSIPFPKRKQKAPDRLAGIDEEDERRKSSGISEALRVRMDPAEDQPTLAPVLSVPQYDQSPTTLPPITPGLVSPGALPESRGTTKAPDYFSLQPLAPVLKTPVYSQGTDLTPITPGLVSPSATGPFRNSPIVAKDFAQADYFNARPGMAGKHSSNSSTGPSSAIVPTQPWDRHGQLSHFMSNTPSFAYSTPSVQPTPPGGRAPGRRVSIEDPSQIIGAEKEEKKESEGRNKKKKRELSLPLPDQHIDIRRNALKKALRRIFVYPVIFVLFWIPPCAKNMLAFNPKRAENDPLWLAVFSNLCVTLMGTAYCLVFLWSEQPWRYFLGESRIWNCLWIHLCLKQAREPEEEGGGYLDFPARSRPPSVKTASTMPPSTDHSTNHGEAPSQSVCRNMSSPQAPEPAAIGGRRGSILGQHWEHGGSSISLPTTPASRTKSISFAPIGQHLAGGSTTSLARQLALERLKLEQQDRRAQTQFQRRLSMHSGPSRMSSKTSVVASLGSIAEGTKREWWDVEEGEHVDSDQEAEE